MLVTLRSGGGEDAVAAVAWGTFVAGVVVHVTLRLFETREELARAAVLRERERFSRDLHDLLGHTLSLVVVKAEAVRRLAPATPTPPRGRRATSSRSGAGRWRRSARPWRAIGGGAWPTSWPPPAWPWRRRGCGRRSCWRRYGSRPTRTRCWAGSSGKG
ncbi:histidine kinase [Nonomuraea recticatena]|uniref:histidine kinase n=1 Tax=Nonomuraea recticatena TaxID=46178 RepID=UPI003611F027